MSTAFIVATWKPITPGSMHQLSTGFRNIKCVITQYFSAVNILVSRHSLQTPCNQWQQEDTLVQLIFQSLRIHCKHHVINGNRKLHSNFSTINSWREKSQWFRCGRISFNKMESQISTPWAFQHSALRVTIVLFKNVAHTYHQHSRFLH